MSIKIGINGFGRIGKMVFRLAISDPDIELVHVNDKMNLELLHHLLKYDSVHSRFKADIEVKNNCFYVNNKKIPITHFIDPDQIPWQNSNVDIVIESSGMFTTRPDLEKHLKKGVKKVILSCPPGDKSIDRTIIMGVNHRELESSDVLISNASCTSNCAAVTLKVLNDEFGILKAFMNTVHPFTNNQNLQDGFHEDFRRARSAMNNIIPTTSSALRMIPLVMPELKNKFDGFATRVPVGNCSFVELTAQVAKNITVEKINLAFQKQAENALKKYLEYCTDPIVSSDVNDNLHSAIYDSLSTKVLGKDLVQLISWYDNEMAYSARIIDLIKYVSKQ